MNRSIAAIAFVAVCAVAFARVQSLAVDSPKSGQQGTISVPLAALGGSGQSGTATLTGTADNQTQVVIAVTGTASASIEPAHIHKGTCANLDPKPTYPLTNVTAGASTSIVAVPLSSLQTGQFSINVHQSTSNLGTYVSCGTIPAAPTGGGMSGGQATPAPMGT
jgi:hypothetical protein